MTAAATSGTGELNEMNQDQLAAQPSDTPATIVSARLTRDELLGRVAGLYLRERLVPSSGTTLGASGRSASTGRQATSTDRTTGRGSSAQRWV